MKPATNRRLAAIMFTDIVGYTAMMQKNESAAAAIRQRHRSIFQKEHERYQGDILQYYGDGTLSIFKSAVEAVECAISMQQQFQREEPVPLRIGIHLGDIVFDDNDVYGDGVNLASRVESLGVPGCILLSDKLHAAIKSHRTISTRSVGFFEFKNIKEAVEVFAVDNADIRVPERAELKGKVKENKKSIAVLPFVNMSSDPENEYFSDGIAEEILNALVKVEGLQVTARTSSFMFKGKNMDVREIGSQLGVLHILEGSVRKAGNRVRITAQLVSSVDGYHFFSETYDRTLEDIFEVQDEIAQKITHRLREHLADNQQGQHLVQAPTLNMEAYELYLKGLYYLNQWDDGAMGKAIPLFEKAIKLQPDFGLAHARLGVCYYFQAFGGGISWAEAREKGMFHINRTKELKVESPEAYFAEFIFEIFSNWNWEAAVKVVKKALPLFPNYASLYHALSTLYWIQGDMSAVIRAHKKGLELDPLSFEMILYMGIAYLWDQQFEEALLYLNKILDMVPTHRVAWEYKGWVAFFQEDYEQALAIFEKLEPPAGYRLHRSTCLGSVYFKIGDIEKANSYLEEVLELEKQFVGLSLDLAALYTHAGDIDRAFQYLEKAIKHKIGDSMMFRSDISLQRLRKDPRYAKMEALVGKMPEIDL